MTELQIKEIICQRFLGGDLSFPLAPDTKLLDEGICDSLGLVQLVAAIENRDPSIKIRDQEVTRENLGSIERIVKFIEQKKLA